MKRIFFCFILVMFCFCSSSISASTVKEIFEQALIAYSKEDYSKAIELFQQTLQIYPKLAASYNYIGLSQKALGINEEDVLASFQKAIEVDPSYVPVYDSLSKYYYSLGKFDEAEQYGLKAVRLNPEMVTAYLSLGWVYLIGKDEPSKAISCFEKAVNKEKFSYGYFGLGIAYYMDNQNPKVLDMITTLREMGEENFALKLEELLRQGPYTPSKHEEFKRMAVPQLPSSAPLQEHFPEVIATPEENAMKVRLKGKVSSPSDENSPSSVPVSAADRIRELQKRGADLPDKAPY
ncbi:MAG: tetratricopeptide repeat protein [Candidatus Omnitrophica bacterium]|nr:tetratricopeptide repeat protein [Candidatus Omnitrophota bacterium]